MQIRTLIALALTGLSMTFAIGFSAPASADAVQNKAVALCDKLAAAPEDRGNPPGLKGVPFNKIDAAAALAPCKTASAAFPKKSRYTFQYGRALQATEGQSQEAFSQYKIAAEAGHAVAMNNLGFAYDNGIGTDVDHAKAVEWYLKSAALGVPHAERNLGLSYRDGSGVKANAFEAENWLKKAGDAGQADAYSELGWMYENALGVQQDDAKAAGWYQRSVKAGSFQGMSNLGWMYDRGVGGLAQNHEKAFQLYLASANGGNADGMNNLAACYINGEGVLPNLNKGLEWLNKAYDAGSDRAAFNLSQHFSSGRVVTRDPHKAAAYLITALERHSQDARLRLIEQAGKKIPIDVIDAVQDVLLKRGGTFQKEPGAFSTEAIAYMTQIADGK